MTELIDNETETIKNTDEDRNTKRYSILIVDDERANIIALTNVLEDDYEIIAAMDGADAIELAEELEPDIILLDVMMPVMDGYETIQELKKSPKTKLIPVFFFTAQIDEKSELKGFKLGAADYIGKPFNPSILRARIATHLTIVEQRRLIEQLSLTDTLTRVPNRRFFDKQMGNEWNRAIREKLPIGMLMIDADHFKKFNDDYCHHQGDVALQTLASVLSNSIKRKTDFVARWGGEEFAIILPNTDIEGLKSVGEQIRKNVESAAIPRIDDFSQVLKITVSIGGVSIRPTVSSSLEVFIDKTDEALYKAKEGGRNRVVIL